MKLLAALVVVAQGQDYDFYSSNSGRFGSVGNFGAAGQGLDGSDGVFDSDAVAGTSAAQNSQITGIHSLTTRYQQYGHSGNRRYCHTTRHNRAVYNWTSNPYGGYFGEGRNIMECMGEELYCFIEERAHFGQIIGITAGCEQMMNHPSVTIQDQQALIDSEYTQINAIKNNYNQEAARGGRNRHGFFTYYGLGGCLAMPAQNGHHFTNPKALNYQRSATNKERIDPALYTVGVDSPAWRDRKWVNYYRNYHGGYGQNQCLRFPKQRLNRADDAATAHTVLNTACEAGAGVDCTSSCTGCEKRLGPNINFKSPGMLLPFGVSVCRACCVAEMTTNHDWTGTYFDSGSEGASLLCNYPPDSDSVINEATDDQFEEIIPRFDMAGPAYNSFQTPNNMVDNYDQDNNLFVHGSWCDESGPARGCARRADDTAATVSGYVYGATSADMTTYEYTCSPAKHASGHQPIDATNNRDWCPGRPYTANSETDSGHAFPDKTAATIIDANVNVIYGK